MNTGDTQYPIHGRCDCGRCRLRIAAEPFQVSYCHCADCRKATGAPVTVFVGFPERSIVYEGERPECRASSRFVERLFCSACGMPMAYRDNRLEDELYLHVGVLDEPERFEPRLHAWVAEALPWLRIEDDLPRYEGFSRSR